MNETADGALRLRAICRVHGLKIITVADLVHYRISKEVLVRRAMETDLPTVYGKFRAVALKTR